MALEKQVADLARELTRLQSTGNGGVTLRSISREDARSEILEMFEAGDVLYYSDIVARLGIDIDEVISVCRELEAEGKIETLGHAA